MTDDLDIAAVRAQMIDLRARIDAIARPWTHRVEVVGVTKGFGPEAIEAAVLAGCDAVGENYAQELLDKQATIERLHPSVHFIGRLQRNKVRPIAGLVDLWCSLDRASVIDEVSARSPGAQVLVQVDTSGDPDKGGCNVADVSSLVDRASARGLIVRGLMTVGPTSGEPDATRRGFRQVRALVDRLGLGVCSMGMTADLDVAVEEGSTQVRIGTALFGQRPPRRNAPVAS